MRAPRLRARSKNAKCVLLFLAVPMNHSDSGAQRGQSRFRETFIEGRRGSGSKILFENFLQPALTGWSWLAPPRGQPKAVEKIFLRKIFDCGGNYHNGGMGASAPIIGPNSGIFSWKHYYMNLPLHFNKRCRPGA